MILNAVKKGVSEERLARALNVDIASIRKKRNLLVGICPEAAELLKDRHVPINVFAELRFMKPLRQIDGALAALRDRAAGWGIRPDKIAVCGFSAGAHLALSSAVLPLPGQTGWEERQRPNALILSYPVVTAGPYAHRGSFAALSGSDQLAAHAAFGLEDKIGPDTPPVFVWHTLDDRTVPAEN